MRRLACLALALLPLGCLGEEETPSQTGPGYQRFSETDAKGLRRDRIRFTRDLNDEQNPYTNADDLLALSKRLDTQEKIRSGKTGPAASETPAKSPHPAPTSGRGSLVQRRARLLHMVSEPRLEDLPVAAQILRDPIDPLSPLAAVAVGRIGGLQADGLLIEALRDGRAPVREAALLVLVDRRADAACSECRRLLVKDPHVAVRGAAAKGLGMLNDRASIPLLRQALSRGNPTIHVPVAWALARMRDETGLAYLKRLALAGDAHVSTGAVQALATLPQLDSIVVLYRCLFAPHATIRNAALASLAQRTETQRQEALKLFSAKDRARAELRRQMLMCQAGRGPMPAACPSLAQHGSEEERILALECMGPAGSVRAVPAAISALADPVHRVRGVAEQALRALVKRHRLPYPPDDMATQEAWQVWWFRLHRLVACTKSEAVLRFPDGKQYRVRQGMKLHWNAPVVRIQPGPSATDLRGAFVEVICNGRPLRVEPGIGGQGLEDRDLGSGGRNKDHLIPAP